MDQAPKSEISRSERTFAALLEIMSALTLERDVDHLLQGIMAKASEWIDAERATLFLIDHESQQLWSKVVQGEGMSEIRVPLASGIVGHVATTGESINIPDAYQDRRFNPEVDRKTGFHTRSVLCMPIRNRSESIIGVLQVLNKKKGVFHQDDEDLLRAFASQTGVVIQNTLLNAEVDKRMRTSQMLLNVMRSVASELELDNLLQKIVGTISEVMNADRATLFLVDPKTGDLWSKVAQGLSLSEIRVPKGKGIVGHVAESGETVNITDAYQDPRFNPEVDRKTGYRTRNMLCMPLRNEARDIIGVLQVLNKKVGVFKAEDESLLDALGSQATIALNNSRLFEEVRFIKNYNESILRTIATGVITLNPDGEVAFSNIAATSVFPITEMIFNAHTEGQHFHQICDPELNPELAAGIRHVLDGGEAFTSYQLQFYRGEDDALAINAHVLPLRDQKGKSLGVVMVADDITQEERLMSTLCRYVTRSVAEQIMKDRESLKLGGQRSNLAVLFSDIRSFTTLSEQSTAEEIVSMLNEYFSLMIKPIFQYEGTLDKFIGDAIMAVFGAPIPHENNAENAVRAALAMRHALRTYNAVRKSRGLPPIDNGIGITLGEAISGNIGSEQRMDYTVIGDTVNIASRLEGLTKNYDCKILINEAAYLEVKDKISCVDLGFAHVKGKEGDVRLYGIPDPPDLRRTQRWQKTFDVESSVDGKVSAGHGFEISEVGLAFRTTTPYAIGTKLGLQLNSSGGDLDLNVQGVVRSQREDVIGVEFICLTPADLKGIMRFGANTAYTAGKKRAAQAKIAVP